MKNSAIVVIQTSLCDHSTILQVVIVLGVDRNEKQQGRLNGEESQQEKV